MSDTERLDDVVGVCLGRHIVHELLGIVQYPAGYYVKMCRACYERNYPDYSFDELEQC